MEQERDQEQIVGVDKPVIERTIDLRDGVIRHRASLKSAMSVLESALERPVGQGGTQWLDRVDAATVRLGTELAKHIEVHEGPNSFHAQILAEQPGLAPRVERARREHVRAQQVLADLMSAILAAKEGRVDGGTPAEIRVIGSDLILLLVHHRQRGADLAWDSVNLDLGSVD